ncbi:hypothetical protein ACQ4PT_043215 [Festuca glaucescens]
MRLTVFSSPSRTPGVHGDDTARQFLEQFPLPKLLGDEEISAITLDAIKRLAEIPKGIDIIFPQEGQGSLQLDKVAAQSSSMALLLSVLQQDPDIRIAVDYAHYTDCISLNVCRAIEYYQDWLSENGA